MKHLMLVFSIIAACVLMASSAMAIPFPPNVANDVYGVAQGGAVNGIPTAQDDNDAIPDINDAINQLQGTAYSRNKDVDHLFMEPDYVWQQLDGAIALIGLTAGFNNSVGVYTDLGVGSTKTHVIGPHTGFGFTGDGTAANPYPAATVGLGSGTWFGWYLYANQAAYYYSEPVLNSSGWDRMMTFDLPGFPSSVYVDFGAGPVLWTLHDPYLMAWEDLPWDNGESGLLGDEDYDDMIYIIDKVAPIPEPGTLLLLGSGLVGLIGCGRFSRKKK